MLDETKMSEIESDQGSKILQLALNNKQIAIAVLGQALLDEGGIGAQSITIYTNKGEAEHLWKIANSLGYANVFRKKKHRNHYHYGFSIMASKRKELFDLISPLPNPVKDTIFRHLSSRRFGKCIRRRGETRTMILQSIAKKPKTVLQLMLEIDTGALTMRSHSKELNGQGACDCCW